MGLKTVAYPHSFRETVTDCPVRVLLTPHIIMTHSCDPIYYGTRCAEGYADFLKLEWLSLNLGVWSP